MINVKINKYFTSYSKPNNIFITYIIICLLNNSIFSINENVSILIHCIIFMLIGFININFLLYKININKDAIITLLIITIPSIIFILIKFKNGISFRGDEIAHHSNSISNLSYWFKPQYYENGLTNFLESNEFSIKNFVNIKIINLLILSIINIFFYIKIKKVFNLILFFSSLLLIFHQNSFSYEYSQGTFFVDNLTQILLYIFLPNSISESIGITNFIFFILYLLILRPLIINKSLSYNDIKIFGVILVFPSLNLLIFSNYQEGIAIIFILLAIENFYKNKDFKSTSILFAIAGCFREVFFLPIIILYIFDLISNKKNFFRNNIFYLTIILPLFYHLLHVSKNSLGEKKLDFIFKLQSSSFNDIYFSQIIGLKLILILIAVLISIYLFYKLKNDKFILLLALNIPIIFLLFLRNNFSFLEIDRFYYLWVIIFYFYILLEFAKFYYSKYLTLFFLILLYLNNISFLFKFNNYEVYTNQSINLYLPIKKILKEEEKFNQLNIFTNLQINRFSTDLYPNLKKVTILRKKINDLKCLCKKDEINIYITEKIKNDNFFCKFDNINNCKKLFNYTNNFYQVEVFK